MLPLPISEDVSDLPDATLKAFRRSAVFICERVRTFRRWVKHIEHPLAIDDMVLIEMNKHNPGEQLSMLGGLFRSHDIIGIVSEAGCPGIADPGYRFALWAHENDLVVRSFTGPSSISLALMNSGFSGQHFTFHGYLSAKKPMLAKELKQLESRSLSQKSAQIFIEAPYRNQQVMEQAILHLQPQTMFHVSVDLRTEQEWSCTRTIANWKKSKWPDLHKRPAVFILRS